MIATGATITITSLPGCAANETAEMGWRCDVCGTCLMYYEPVDLAAAWRVILHGAKEHRRRCNNLVIYEERQK